ncbi:MAG: RHS repeat-associated core domain-containing protein [Actinomycetota bacterium]
MLQVVPDPEVLPGLVPEAKADPPTLSGAEPAYPLNHTIDGAVEEVGTPPENPDFEDPSEQVGDQPTNLDLEAAAASLATPSNNDFETGDFTGWTVTSDPSIQTTSGDDWAKLGSSDTITSTAITVPSDAQSISYDVNYVTANNYSWVKVYILTGATYSTSTLLLDDYCDECGYWSHSWIDVSAYAGQSVKLKFSRYLGEVGIDDVVIEETFPSHTLAGDFRRETDAGNDYVRLGSSITTEAFEVDAEAQRGTVRIKGSGTGPQYSIKVAVGPSFSTYTQVAIGSAPTSWTEVRFDLTPYIGDDVKVRLQKVNGTIFADDVVTQIDEIPRWAISSGVSLVDDGAGNHYAKINGTITTGPIEIPATAHDLVLAARTDPNSGPFQNVPVSVIVLYGTGYAQSATTDSNATTNSWATYRYGVGAFAGQTVKLKIQTGSGTADVDDVNAFEQVLPGWTNTSGDALSVGEDANGTYVYASDGGGAVLRSSWINTGVLGDSRTYTISFWVGTCGTCIYQVGWTNQSSSSWNVLSTSTPRGVYRTSRIHIHDFMGSRGYFTVEMVNGGRLYSLGDNIARQRMSEPFSSRVGVGIDTTTGTVAFAEQDVSLPGTMPLTFTRYYNAHSDRLGTLGYRWSHTYDTHLEFVGSDVAVVYGSGREEYFDEFVGDYTPVDPRVHSTLVEEGDGSFTLTTKDNQAYAFTFAGRLSSITDLNGNAITLSYDGSGLLTTIEAPGDRTLSLTYSSGRLVSVTDPLDAVYAYGYDASGDLVSVTDPEDGVRSYTYDRHRLSTVTDQEAQQVVAYTYDEVGRVISQTDATDATIDLAYDTPGKGATEVTDPEEGVATFYFDAAHRTTDAVDPVGNRITYLFDANGNLEQVIDPAFNAWEFDFDADGDLNELLDPLANPVSFTYNAKHLPTTVTDGNGHTTTLAYDGDGNLISSTDPLDRETTFTYDADGNMLTKTDPLEQTWTYTYDAGGHKLTETDPLDNTWTYTYDGAGRLKTETDPLDATTTYYYDLLGRLILIQDPLDRETEFLYDAVGHLLRVTDPTGAETLWDYDERGLVEAKIDANGETWTYAYDDNGRMVSMTDPLSHTTTWAYDDAGQLISETDPLSNTTTWDYDEAGRLVSEVDPLARATSYAYDDAGRLVSTTLPNTATIAYGYDDAGNLTTTTDALSNVTANTYDDANQLTSVTDPLLNITSYTYDDAGRRLTETDPLSNTTTYIYDDAGRLTGVTDPLDNTTTYTLDALGRTIETTDATGRTTGSEFDDAGQLVATTDGLEHETTYGYDLAGRLTSVLLPSGAETTYTYDDLGNRLSVTDPLLNTTSYAYDDAGRLVSEIDPLENETTYAYDAADRMTLLTDALGGEVAFGYDHAGQLTSLTDPNEETWTYSYDALGNRANVTDPLSNVTSFVYDDRGQLVERTDGRGVETTWTYDERGLPTTIEFPGSDVTYAYDDAGRRTSMVDDTGTTTWAYDDAGQVSSVAAPAGTIAYDWDDAGRRSSMTLPGGREIGYGYDLAGQLDSLTDPSNDETTFDYDEDGRRIEIDRPNGVISTYTYDDAGRIAWIDHAKDASTLLSFDYTYDDRGLRTSMTSQAGTETYVHDELGQLISVTYADSEEVTYTYDDAGNRLTETRDSVPTAYTYDDAGGLASVGAASATNDDAGNLTELGTDEYSYDYGNRLVSATANGHDATYTYDGDGVRVASEIDSTPVDYLVDREGGLPTIVDDESRAYLHADGLIEATGGGDVFPLTDALGSVRAVTDAGGSVVGTRSYEAFGATRSQTGAALGFGHTGEPSDATGSVYLRARTLDPSLGRFLQADTVRPSGPGSLAYNLYAYAENDPATWVDPSGHQVSGTADSVSMLPSIGAILVSVLVGLRGLCFAGGVVAAICTAVVIVAIGMAAMALIGVIFQCSSVPGCLRDLLDDWNQIKQLGSFGLGLIAALWTAAQLMTAVKSIPSEPAPSSKCAQAAYDTGRLESHVIPRHLEGSQLPQFSWRSYFYRWVNLSALIAISRRESPVASGSLCLRVVAMGEGNDIGVDKVGGLGSTDLFTVITRLDGSLFTMYPGVGEVGPI